MEDIYTEIKGDKFLSFSLGSENYGIDIHRVIEIHRVKTITPVPGSPFYIKGVINLRGKVIPVVDLRLKLEMDEIPYNEKTCIIIIHTNEDSLIGLVVDTVLEVAPLKPSELLARPDFANSVKNEYIMAFGKLPDNSMLILLDINKILSDEDSDKLQTAMAGNESESIVIK